MSRLMTRRGGGGTGPMSRVAAAGVCAVLTWAATAAMAGTGATADAATATGAVTAGGATAEDTGPYAFAKGAPTIAGARTSTDAPELRVGGTYRSVLGGEAGDALYYRVALDGTSNAYVSAVAVPGIGNVPGTGTGTGTGTESKVAYSDGVVVTLQDDRGNRCGSDDATFRSGAYPRPIAATAERALRPRSLRCSEAGTYYVVVERHVKETSSAGPWGLELHVAAEPALKSAGATEGPENWPSSSPTPFTPPTGAVVRRDGGTGFNDAAGLRTGSWKTDIQPGQTLFYRVPLDWGQQLFLRAELGSAAEDASRPGFVPGALDMELYNPARSLVVAKDASYGGEPTSAVFDPLPPVAYENRYLLRGDRAAMRFAGSYYLKVSLSPAMAKTFGDKESGVTLRVTVGGAAKAAPAYVRDPGEFQVTGADREAGGGGSGADGAPGDVPDGASNGGGGGDGGDGAQAGAASGDVRMRVLGFAGVGTGAALVLWLAVWRVVAGRRIRGAAG